MTDPKPPPSQADPSPRAAPSTGTALEPGDADARRRAETEARVAKMQFEQVPIEGGPAKSRLALWPSQLVALLAAVLPIRVRTAFGFALNFLFNRVGVTLRFLAAGVSGMISAVAIFLLYYLVIGPSSLLARALRYDDLTERRAKSTMFQTKAPPDDSDERFLRQY